MELIRYLNEGFFTQAQLLAACGIDLAQLTALQQRGVVPQASYRLKLDLACDSFFGPHSEQASIDYYAKGYASWTGLVQTLARDADAYDVFETRYQRRLEQLRAAGASSSHDKLNAGLGKHLEDEWRHFLSGTYGLCTRSGLPEDIAAKEVAIAIIKDITEQRQTPALGDAERASLTVAVDLLDAASSMFAPHERARSSRHRLVDQMRETYRLKAGGTLLK